MECQGEERRRTVQRPTSKVKAGRRAEGGGTGEGERVRGGYRAVIPEITKLALYVIIRDPAFKDDKSGSHRVTESRGKA